MKLLCTFILLTTIAFISLGQNKFTVVLDAGHGGYDPGAIANGIIEKNIVLKIANKTGKILEKDNSFNILYTRETDNQIPLHKRAQIAVNAKTDLFISIHANSYEGSQVRGTEIFILGMHNSNENLEIAKKENSVILIEDNFEKHYEGFNPNSSESYIIFDLIQEEYFNQSLSIASKVHNNIKINTSRRSRGIKQAGFLVLKQVSAPSILMEVGYLTNSEEATYLNSNKGQQELAEALAKSVIEYRQEIYNIEKF